MKRERPDSYKHSGRAIDEDGPMILLENEFRLRKPHRIKTGEIAEIINEVGGTRIGFCFDTCHAFAAGYDLATKKD